MRLQIMEVIWPLFAGLAFILKALHRTLFAWWLDPWLQRRANDKLWDDIKSNFPSLCKEGRHIKDKRIITTVLPFDYASVSIACDNLRLCFTRGRDELNVTCSHYSSPDEAYELALVIGALDSKDVTDLEYASTLPRVAELFGRRRNDINAAFSDESYPQFRLRLLRMREEARILTRQSEWELNKHLYH